MSTANKFSTNTSDILDQPVDSSQVLLGRLEQWKHAVAVVHKYAQSQLHKQNNISSDLAKQQKVVADVPSFGASNVTSTSGGAAGAAGGAAGGSVVTTAFQALVKQTQVELQESEKVAESIKSRVLPPLEDLDSELSKHHKTLSSEAHKLTKEAEKQRENTAKHLENLGRSVPAASHNASKADPKNDPYILHRQVRSAATDQIATENQLSESNLNVQSNFGPIEQRVVDVLQKSLKSLSELTQHFSQVSAQSAASTEQQFAAIRPDQEWAQFRNANSNLFVPESGYARDPNKVTFANAGADATVPLIEGSLSRKGTVLGGNKHGYYVLSPSGFLHEFKSADHNAETHPVHSLYIPDAEISGLPAQNSGDLTFRIDSRDSNKPLSPHHKYTFQTTSYEDLVAWHTALARVAGATAATSGTTSATSSAAPSRSSTFNQGEGVPVAGAGATDAYGGAPAATGYESETSGLNSPAAGTGSAQQYGSVPGVPSGGSEGLTAASSGTGLGGSYGQPGFQGSQGVPGGAVQQGGLGQQHQAQPDLSRGVDNLNLGSQHQAQSGLGHDVNSLRGAPQQAQPGLGHDVNNLRSAPQQAQSGLGHDANDLRSAPQQFQSGAGHDVNNLRSAPQQAQSGLRNDASQFTSGPQSQVSSGIDQAKGAPQQFDSSLKDGANQFTRGL